MPLENSIIWGELGLVQKDLADVRATVSTLSTSVASLQETVASLQETVASLQETVATLQETVAKLQKTVATRDDIQKNIDMIESKKIRDCILMGAWYPHCDPLYLLECNELNKNVLTLIRNIIFLHARIVYALWELVCVCQNLTYGEMKGHAQK